MEKRRKRQQQAIQDKLCSKSGLSFDDPNNNEDEMERIIKGVIRESIQTHVVDEDIRGYSHPSFSQRSPLQFEGCVPSIVLANSVHSMFNRVSSARIPSREAVHTTIGLDIDPTVALADPHLYKKRVIAM